MMRVPLSSSSSSTTAATKGKGNGKWTTAATGAVFVLALAFSTLYLVATEWKMVNLPDSRFLHERRNGTKHKKKLIMPLDPSLWKKRKSQAVSESQSAATPSATTSPNDVPISSAAAPSESPSRGSPVSASPTSASPSGSPSASPTSRSPTSSSASPTSGSPISTSPSASSPTSGTPIQLKSSSHHVVKKHYWWSNVNVTAPIVPLVDPTPEGMEANEINKHTNESIYFVPSKGYSFPKNGQGNQWGNHFYPANVLNYKLEPDKVMSKREALDCLNRMKWIHIDGDSLARDIFYDLGELYGMGWNDKQKTLQDQLVGPAEEVGDGKGGGPRFSFSANTINEIQPTPNWYSLKKKYQKLPYDCPDVWIYSSGLWDHPRGTTNEFYRKRTKALADFVVKNNNNCTVPHKILRYTTPYQLRKRKQWNENAKQYNAIATELLVPVGFQYVDTFEILSSRKDLSHDGIHYTGPGSKWVTNSILNLFCSPSSLEESE